MIFVFVLVAISLIFGFFAHLFALLFNIGNAFLDSVDVRLQRLTRFFLHLTLGFRPLLSRPLSVSDLAIMRKNR